jgi:hypothetical protein
MDIVITVIALAIGFGLGQLNLIGKRKGIREARFDSKTGKEIE